MPIYGNSWDIFPKKICASFGLLGKRPRGKQSSLAALVNNSIIIPAYERERSFFVAPKKWEAKHQTIHLFSFNLTVSRISKVILTPFWAKPPKGMVTYFFKLGGSSTNVLSCEPFSGSLLWKFGWKSAVSNFGHPKSSGSREIRNSSKVLGCPLGS